MRDVIVLLLPVAWALVATFIGIALYKSSEALFENVSGTKSQKRTIRLTGSVVIAALAFYGIRSATPTENLFVEGPGIRAVSIEELRLVEQELADVLDDLIELEACVSLDQVGSCRDHVVRVQRENKEVHERIRSIIDE